MEKLIGVQEAALLLALSPHTIRSWVSQGRIPFLKVGRRCLFSLSDLEGWIEAHRVKPRRDVRK